MTAVAIAPLGRTEVVQWLAPAPLWDALSVGAGASGLTQPWITELETDTFVDDFTGILAGAGGATPSDLATMAPSTTVGGIAGAPYRLFQPLSGRFYLVAAELVCHRPGIPDHAVTPALGETTSFVMRRLTATGDEEGFVAGLGDTGTWLPAQPGLLLAGEKEYPMHPASVAPYALPGTTTAALGLDSTSGTGRTLYYGYIPVALRDKLVRPMADPVQALFDLAPAPGGPSDPILSWLYQRVIYPWRQLAAPPLTPTNIPYASLYLLLDLGDWLKQHLAPVYGAIVDGDTVSGAYRDLVDAFDTITIGGDSLTTAIRDTAPYAPLITGDDIPGPSTSYDLSSSGFTATWLADVPTQGSLAQLAKAALAVAPERPVLPPELEGMIQEHPVTPPGAPEGSGPTYVIRAVYQHDPCQPVLSEATPPFELARAMDPDAPARKVLLQMPDIRHMRSFKRGIAIETPPKLQEVLNRMTPDMLKGGPMGPDGGLQLGWICSFSIQIIFIVAFVVMFIFLLLLNICFFWMPFFKICFPVPVPAPVDQGPTP